MRPGWHRASAGWAEGGGGGADNGCVPAGWLCAGMAGSLPPPALLALWVALVAADTGSARQVAVAATCKLSSRARQHSKEGAAAGGHQDEGDGDDDEEDLEWLRESQAPAVPSPARSAASSAPRSRRHSLTGDASAATSGNDADARPHQPAEPLATASSPGRRVP